MRINTAIILVGSMKYKARANRWLAKLGMKTANRNTVSICEFFKWQKAIFSYLYKEP